MKNLIAFLAKYHHWLLFLFLEVIGGVMLFQYNSYQGSVWFTSANAVTGKVYELRSMVTTFFSLIRVNEELTLRNFYLERQVTQLRSLYTELTQDTTVMERTELEMLSKYKLVSAKVVDNSVDRPDNFITIDRGRNDGVDTNMPVACGNGVVGVVYLASDHYSVVIPVLNTSASRISCAIRRRGYFGYLHWTGGDPSVAFIEDSPRHARFTRGEWVETSGYSSIFPPGVLVGQIEKIYNSPDGLSFRLKVRLSTDFANLRNVVVINDKSIGERNMLQKAAKDSLEVMKARN